MDNIRTLCLRCHRAATVELRQRLRIRKKLQPGDLKAALSLAAAD